MITFDKENMIFYLNTKSTTYAMGIWNNEKLVHRYWGKRLVNHLKKTTLTDYGCRVSVAIDLQDTSSDIVPFEYSAYGNADMRIPSVEFTFGDGSHISSLIYKGYEISEGKPILEGLPATYCENGDNVQTLTICLEDVFQKVCIFLSYSVFEDLDAITRNAKIVNNGNNKLLLDSVMSATVDFYGSPERELLHLDGAWTRERHIKRQPIFQGNQSVGSRYGCSSAFHNPFIALCDKGATEKNGNVYGMSLVYSGNFTAGVEQNAYNSARAYIGINPVNFQYVLEKGESFQTPETVLVYSANGIGEMSRIYHRLFRTRLCRGKYRDAERFVLINNWEATYFNFDEDKIVSIAKKAAEIGIDTLVLDDGWFSSRLNDFNGLGDWYENRDRLPNGLEGLAEKINALGMKFGLWFEPEMVNPGTELYKKHPDWILHVEGRIPSLSRNQYTLDLSRDDVCQYITDCLCNILSRANIEYVKWDMNRYMAEPGSSFWGGEHQGEIMHRYILGLYKILETVVSRFPNVLFESCAGGGARFDPGMLYYAPQTWTSDDTDAVERLKIQYGTSVVYPFSSMGAHVSAVPNHQVGRITAFDMRCNVALPGQFGFEMDLGKCTDDELKIAGEAIKTYHKLGEVFHKGDCYRLCSPFEGGLSAIEFVSEDKNTVILTVNSSNPVPNAPDKYILLDGLQESAAYTVDGTELTFGGDFLMNIGYHYLNDSVNKSEIVVFKMLVCQ